MDRKPCTKCGVVKPLTDYSPRKTGRLKRESACRKCMAAIKQANWIKNKHRRCPKCRLSLDVTEQPGTCKACQKFEALKVIVKDLPSRLARPGCLTYGSTCKVLDEANERWVEMPVKHCKRCGIDQHLDVCLDCTAPVGARDKQKSIRPLQGCVDCGAWAVNARCPDCLL